MAQRKLLLADDSITIQKVINLTFADEGIEVTSVGNGQTAIDKLHEVAPDLVLADVHMPGLTGYEVCERIRQTPGFENIPVMLLVGSFEPFDETEARRVGANDFLTKPFQSIKQLVSKVHSLLEETQNPAPEQPAQTQSYAASSAAANQDTAFNFFDDIKKGDEDLLQVSENNRNFRDAVFDDEMIETSSRADFADTFEDLNVSELSAQPEKAKNEWHVVEPQKNDFQFENFTPSQHDAPTVELDINQIIGQNPATEQKTEINEDVNLQFEDEPTTSDQVSEERASEFAADSNDFQLMLEEDTPPQTFSSVEKTGETPPQAVFAEPAKQEKTISPFADLFDDDDLLGIEDEIRAEIGEQNAAPQSETETSEVITPEVVAAENENQSQELAPINQSTEIEKPNAFANLNFPPEVIDAIAARVVERLSDKVIEKIAWEIVPDRFDLIVRKTIQNKDRER